MSPARDAAFLVSGGAGDPNLASLVAACERAGVRVHDARFDRAASPSFSWDLQHDRARLDGRALDAAAAFVRYDVFTATDDSRGGSSARSSGWFQSVSGWLLAHDGVRMFNRAMRPCASNKAAQLRLARDAGLRVPRTWITNAHEDFEDAADKIVKPVNGGDFCRRLADVARDTELRDGRAAMPAIVQQTLVAPEVRIYIVGTAALAFEMRSESLDYRERQDVAVVPIDPPSAEVDGLQTLMDALGMDFGAADLKTDPESGALVFLELNTSPMFARFDAESGGLLCDVMIASLLACDHQPLRADRVEALL